jgi:hypothetical protein
MRLLIADPRKILKGTLQLVQAGIDRSGSASIGGVI